MIASFESGTAEAFVAVIVARDVDASVETLTFVGAPRLPFIAMNGSEKASFSSCLVIARTHIHSSVETCPSAVNDAEFLAVAPEIVRPVCQFALLGHVSPLFGVAITHCASCESIG